MTISAEFEELGSGSGPQREAVVIEYLFVPSISLMVFLCFTKFIEQLVGSPARRAPANLSATRPGTTLRGEPK
jgi:hypothetical protein